MDFPSQLHVGCQIMQISLEIDDIHAIAALNTSNEELVYELIHLFVFKNYFPIQKKERK